jgi:hypothetical protein
MYTCLKKNACALTFIARRARLTKLCVFNSGERKKVLTHSQTKTGGESEKDLAALGLFANAAAPALVVFM